MAIVNNTQIIRRELLTRMASLYQKGELFSQIDRIPIEISKRISEASDRCCVHKLRAVAKYKLMALLGFSKSDEEDELTMLKEYLSIALLRETNSLHFLTVVDEACTSCHKSSYIVSNLCRGCIAQPCVLNCPKNAVNRKSNGQAEIDSDRCVNCGKCKELCPYHAIIYMPIPCEEACPVNAISKDEKGIEQIDKEKCILCGKCVNACPFGSIMEVSNILQIMNEMQQGKSFIAMVAPSISGQYLAPDDKISNAIKSLGFKHVINVATGAQKTAEHEALEIEEKINEGQSFVTNSCCAAWVYTIENHINEMTPNLSSTKSPMAYTAELCKKRWPDSKTVFIGPCIAKRKEGFFNPNVDYVITFEELGCWLNGWNISQEEVDNDDNYKTEYVEFEKFAISGGLSEAVKQYFPSIKSEVINGLNRKNIKSLKGIAQKQESSFNFLEVMACENGCVCGPSNHNFSVDSQKIFNAKVRQREEQSQNNQNL